MLTAGNTSFTYDDNGNMLTKTTNAQTTTQTWDVLGQLVKLDNPDGSSVKFVYDGVGHRVKRWRSNGNETVYFVNDKSGDLVQLLAEVDSTGATVAEYTLGNTLLTMDRGGVTYSYHFDALGSTRVVTDNTQTPTLTYTYDAYGNVLSSTGTLTNPYQFVAAYGYYSDPDTGLLYLRARYYSPTIGRFVSMDSYLGKDNDPASLHRYLYCVNGPIIAIDPTGHVAWGYAGLIVGGIVVLVGVSVAVGVPEIAIGSLIISGVVAGGVLMALGMGIVVAGAAMDYMEFEHAANGIDDLLRNQRNSAGEASSLQGLGEEIGLYMLRASLWLGSDMFD